MFFLLGGDEKKAKKAAPKAAENIIRVRELFLSGRFPVVTTPQLEGKALGKVLGLVVCRGYDSEEAFFGMAAMAVNKGAQAIIGYQENVAFHPDGTKYFCCYGTAVQFEIVKQSARALALSEQKNKINAAMQAETSPLIM